MSDKDFQRFTTIGDVARTLGCDARTVRRGIEDGVIPAVRIRNTIRIPTSWVHQAANLEPLA